jgi:hypothetical protein
MKSRRECEAPNEARFRDQNEWIEATHESFGSPPLMAFACECGDAECALTIELTKADKVEACALGTARETDPRSGLRSKRPS